MIGYINITLHVYYFKIFIFSIDKTFFGITSRLKNCLNIVLITISLQRFYIRLIRL